MFPFAYYIDCRGDLWVPCHCGCGGEEEVGIESAAAGRERREVRREIRREERREGSAGDPAGDFDLRREYGERGGERICRASKTEEAMLKREMGLDKAMDEILAAVRRLEKLHEKELEGQAPEA